MDNKKTTREIKVCTITGVSGYKEEFYKDGKYPYATFAEAFRAKHKIPVAELRRFCELLEFLKATNVSLHHLLPK